MVACGCDHDQAERIMRRQAWHDLDDFFCRGPNGQRDYWRALPICTVGVPPQMPDGQMRAQLTPAARGSVSSEVGGAPASVVGSAWQGAAGHGRGGGLKGGAPKAGPRQPKEPPPGVKAMAKKHAQQGGRVAAASAPGAAGQVIASKLILRARTTIDSTVSRSTTNHSHSSVTIA